MKRILLAFIICGALLASCSKDDNIPSEEKIVVTFTLDASEVSTRAYGDGTTVNDLRYAIYAQTNPNLPLVVKTIKGAFTGDATSTTISEELIRGNEYTALFWADYDAGDTYNNNAGARYEINWYNNTVTMNINGLTANNEEYDAFFAREDFTASNLVTVELRRPFAQLNIATSDFDVAAQNGIEVTQTALSIEAYTQLDLWTGEVDNLQPITFAEAGIPTASDETTIEVDGKQYRRLSMNYILVGDTDTEHTAAPIITVSGTKNNGAEAMSFQQIFTDVKLKRNRRTNIVGNIITRNVSSN